jgi:hypothetical protein
MSARDIMNISNSFLSPTLCFSSEEITLNNGFIKGNVILKADKRIIVRSSCLLEDVILWAPEIIIEDETQGRFQAMASRSIVIGRDAKIEYPSAFCLFRVSPRPDTLEMVFKEGATFSGLALVWQLEYSPSPILVNIPKKVEIFGQVFADATVNLQGNIVGNLSCTKVAYQTPGIYLGNYMVDGQVDRCKLSEDYLSPFFEHHIKEEKILKWLY